MGTCIEGVCNVNVHCCWRTYTIRKVMELLVPQYPNSAIKPPHRESFAKWDFISTTLPMCRVNHVEFPKCLLVPCTLNPRSQKGCMVESKPFRFSRFTFIDPEACWHLPGPMWFHGEGIPRCRSSASSGGCAVAGPDAPSATALWAAPPMPPSPCAAPPYTLSEAAMPPPPPPESSPRVPHACLPLSFPYLKVGVVDDKGGGRSQQGQHTPGTRQRREGGSGDHTPANHSTTLQQFC